MVVATKTAALASSTLALAGTSEATTSALALAGTSAPPTSALALAGAYNLAFRGRLRLSSCLWCSLRSLGGGSALVLIGLFSHGYHYMLIPALRASSARALNFP